MDSCDRGSHSGSSKSPFKNGIHFPLLLLFVLIVSSYRKIIDPFSISNPLFFRGGGAPLSLFSMGPGPPKNNGSIFHFECIIFSGASWLLG